MHENEVGTRFTREITNIMKMMIIQPPIVTSHHLFYFLTILCLFHAFLSDANKDKTKCIEEERQALLEFKQGILVDHCGKLSSWGDLQNNGDCCQWRGIICNNFTSHVIAIDLGGGEGNNDDHNPCLEGQFSSSLLKLKHLELLDLSFNNFLGQHVPKFIGSFANLRHLNLSKCGFVGRIPQSFTKFSHLSSLDLSENYVNIQSLDWVSHLKALSVINLNKIDLSEAQDWFHIVTNLPFLKVLQMEWCNLPPPSALQQQQPSMVPSIWGNLSSSNLQFLSLAHNSFGDPSVLWWLFNLSEIKTHLLHLDLTDNLIPGLIPRSFATLHSLSYLDLSSNAFEGHIPNSFGYLHTLSHLDLSANLLNGSIPNCFRNLSSLSHLDVSGNQLEGRIPEFISNLPNLIHLDLSYNLFQGTVPKSLGRLCGLQYLELSNNSLIGDLPSVIQTLSVCSYKSLTFLGLENNQFWGSVPEKIGIFSSLKILLLDGNQLNGTITQEISKLSMIESLKISSNSLIGTVNEFNFANLSKLRTFDLSYNPSLVVNISVDWVPPFQLDTFDMSLCKLGPNFPKWLQTQTRISWIDISISGISDTIPASFWSSLSPELEYLNMSHNNIYGVLPSNLSITFKELPEIDLSLNAFEGAIPSFLGNISSLYLNDNKFSNPIPFLCPKSKVTLSNLDLSNNLLFGELPNCWMYFDQLSILRLENNGFFGSLPSSIGSLKDLQALHMRNNSFSGQLPVSLLNCTSLVLFDASYNSLNGHLPTKIGYHLTKLGILSLRSNNFSGVLPSSVCQLTYLQILDLSLNQFSGYIPRCISNLRAMKTTEDLLPDISLQYDFSVILSYYDAEFVMWKGKDQIFRKTLGEVKFVHMSDNNLEGVIPEGFSHLIGLISFDLSNNKLNGSISPRLGKLKELELLDLSRNHLSGEIPETLADLNFLGILNLSYNNLSGRVPTGTLLQGFDASTYMGNPGLCGPPLGNCPRDQPPAEPTRGDDVAKRDVDDSGDVFPGLYVSVVLGFIVGFWGVCGTLVVKRSWRCAFFQALDGLKDRICVMIYGN